MEFQRGKFSLKIDHNGGMSGVHTHDASADGPSLNTKHVPLNSIDVNNIWDLWAINKAR